MDKTAQKRNLLNKLHEMANVPARSAEEFFKPELKRVMNVLIDADDVVRSALAGERVGKAAPEDPVSAKSLLKEAKSFINRREYLSAVANLGRFHKKMQDVSNVLDTLKLNVESIHHQFLFNKLPTKHREHLDQLGQRFSSERLGYFTKEAGIMDFFHNIGTTRGRALAAWEKRYPKVVGKIREGALSQLESSQSLLDNALSLLKTMASARAGRNIDAYLEAGRELSGAFKKYDSGKGGFRSYYNDTIKPFMDIQRKMEEQQNTALVDQSKKSLETAPTENPSEGSVPNVAPLPTGITPPVNAPVPEIPSAQQANETLNKLEEKYPTTSPPSTIPSPPPSGIPISGIPDKFKSDEVAERLFGPKKSSYDAFVDSLEVFVNEDPSLLATHIAKYAQSIQSENPETALKLFKIVNSLRV